MRFFPVFRIRIRIQIHWPDWIRIQSGSGSETLLFLQLYSLIKDDFFSRFLTRQCVPSWGHSQCGNVNENAPSSEINSMSQFLCNHGSSNLRDRVVLETLEGRSSPLFSADLSELKGKIDVGRFLLTQMFHRFLFPSPYLADNAQIFYSFLYNVLYTLTFFSFFFLGIS